MAKYKEMPAKNLIDTSFCAAGYIDNSFILSVGPLRIYLTKEEKDDILHTWNLLENGINPETNRPF